MNDDQLKSVLESQFAAAFSMFVHCLEQCPAERWDETVAKYPFWLVAYHTLYCTDLYLSVNEDAFELSPVFHPGGASDVEDEYPSRTFSKDEVLAYARFCKEKAQAAFARETPESLAGDSGFRGRNLSRAELHIYNTRHIMHHTGQLSAIARRAGGNPKWVSRGWA